MNTIPRLLRALLAEPLLIEPRTGAAIVRVFGRKLQGESFTGEDLHAELGIQARRGRRETPPKVAVIPIHGVIAQGAHSLGASTDVIEAEFESALADSQVDAVLFHIRSPGGTVDGVPELADKILKARGTKPMLALADGLMASAAYWIGSAADEVMVAPSGETGSIGVWTAHEDWSRFLQNEGIDVTILSAGKYKVEGNFFEPLTKEARGFFQERVDEVYDWFVRAVAQNRRDTQTNVRSGYGEGRVLSAKQSVQAKLADRVGTFDDAVERLIGRVKQSRRGQRAQVLRERLELEHPA